MEGTQGLFTAVLVRGKLNSPAALLSWHAKLGRGALPD